MLLYTKKNANTVAAKIISDFTYNEKMDDYTSYHTAERPTIIEMIRSEIRGEKYTGPANLLHKPNKDLYHTPDLFDIRPADKWFTAGKRVERPKMLFDNFWYEGELCLLFADTNVGKSILAVQLGNLLACGSTINGFCTQAAPSRVVYFDLEQDAGQFEARYSCYDGPFKFNADFFRADISAALKESHYAANRVKDAIEACICKTNAKVLIIDNLTYLAGTAGRAGDACILIRYLKEFKRKYKLSILALAHTPKRDPSKPISNNDMQGSKMIMNFCDSAFAMGTSHTEPGLRYLKQIKQRNAEQTYGENHVCLMRIDRAGGNLRLLLDGHDAEGEHLIKKQFVPIVDRRKIIKLHSEGLSNRKIAHQLGISHTSVNRVIEIEGQN